MTPSWLNDTVRAFGRQLALESFELNDRGAAGVRFENGLSFRLEYAEGALFVSMGVGTGESADMMKRLLAMAHPQARVGARVRAVYCARANEARLVMRLQEREVTVTAVESAFQVLWTAADELRRALA